MSENRCRHLVKEQPHQAKAFEYYYSLGEHRSYDKIATKFGVARSTVKLWGTSFRWRERIRDRDLEVAREVATRTLDSEVSRRKRNTQIIHMAILQLAKAVAEGQVKMTLSDLDKLIRLEAYLNDDPDSRQEIILSDLQDKSDDELRAMVKREIALLDELSNC
jgi:transposase